MMQLILSNRTLCCTIQWEIVPVILELASHFALVWFWIFLPDYSLNSTLLGPITITKHKKDRLPVVQERLLCLEMVHHNIYGNISVVYFSYKNGNLLKLKVVTPFYSVNKETNFRPRNCDLQFQLHLNNRKYLQH